MSMEDSYLLVREYFSVEMIDRSKEQNRKDLKNEKEIIIVNDFWLLLILYFLTRFPCLESESENRVGYYFNTIFLKWLFKQYTILFS